MKSRMDASARFSMISELHTQHLGDIPYCTILSTKRLRSFRDESTNQSDLGVIFSYTSIYKTILTLNATISYSFTVGFPKLDYVARRLMRLTLYQVRKNFNSTNQINQNQQKYIKISFYHSQSSQH
jgi:hypothetical protein